MINEIKCPKCRNMTAWSDNPWRPFCSQRCKTIDFGDWASEKHCIHEPLMTNIDEEAATNFDLYEMGTPHGTDGSEQ